MGVRPFAGVRTLAGSAEPIFGTAITAAFTPPPDPYQGNLQPGTNETQVVVTVTSTKGFLDGDRVAVGPTAAFSPGLIAAASIPDQGTVKKIVDSTHLVIQGLKQSHAASGEWVVLNETIGNVHLSPVAISATTYVGNSSAVAAGDQGVIDSFPSAATLPIDFESIGSSQPMQLSAFWILGSGTYIPRFTQV